MAPTHYEAFINIVNELYAGVDFTHPGETIRLPPTILQPYDLISVIREPQNDYERYLSSLPTSFRATARAELYRRGTGWITRGITRKNRRIQ